jgi:hypothetical protein
MVTAAGGNDVAVVALAVELASARACEGVCPEHPITMPAARIVTLMRIGSRFRTSVSLRQSRANPRSRLSVTL